jgi:hypothetical protein
MRGWTGNMGVESLCESEWTSKFPGNGHRQPFNYRLVAAIFKKLVVRISRDHNPPDYEPPLELLNVCDPLAVNMYFCRDNFPLVNFQMLAHESTIAW